MNLIYLDKRGDEHDTSKWAYYRLKGNETGGNADAALVSFPDFKDTVPVISIGLSVGMDSIYKDTNIMLKNAWNIDRERSILIGVIKDEITI